MQDGQGGIDASAGELSFDPQKVRFVLVQPKNSGNIGAAARALKNLGFTRLAIVDPLTDPFDQQAQRMAVDAVDLLRSAQVVNTLDEAISDAQMVVGTSGRGGKYRQPHFRLDELSTEMTAFATTGELAFIFGREDHGLLDSDLDRCTHLVYFPASVAYSSFNLAQSVLLTAYQLVVSGLGPPAEAPLEPVAAHAVREEMYDHLGQALLSIGFARGQTVETIMRRFRRTLGRAGLAERDVKLFRGLSRQILWAAAQAGLTPETPETDTDETDTDG